MIRKMIDIILRPIKWIGNHAISNYVTTFFQKYPWLILVMAAVFTAAIMLVVHL